MKITMLENAKGSENGTVVKAFEKGNTYDVADVLGEMFIEDKVAKKASAKDARKATVPGIPGSPGATA